MVLMPSRQKKTQEVSQLIAAARDAMSLAYAPYSRFSVGAAILTSTGETFSGCNVENAAYGHSVCAERVALFKAVSTGYRGLSRIAIVCSSGKPVAPCGACRQSLWEFAPDLDVIMAGTRRQFTVKINKLLPYAFGPLDLPDQPD